MNLLEKDKKYIWHPYTSLQPTFEPLLITHAEGIYLYTSEGKRIIDAISSWWVNLHGHSNPAIAEAIALQAKKLEHVIFAGFTHEPAIQLAENLLSILPENQSKIFFSDNGSTAVEVAIKMAIQFWRNQGNTTRKKIIALEGAYHGDTFGAMAVGGRSIFTQSFNDFLFDVEFLDFPTDENRKTLIDRFESIAKKNTAAAFIFEPLVQGASGMRTYSAETLESLLQIAKRHNIVTIADEVFTGFGRTGKIFASDYLNSTPDIFCLSKGITGGALPLGATSCSSEIEASFQSNDYLKTLYHGHSYTANPIVCAAANASFQLTTSKECLDSIQRISDQQTHFANSIREHEKIEKINVLGTILSIELKTSANSGYTNEIRNRIYPYFLEKGILLRPLGNTIYIVPPYVITSPELKLVHDAIRSFVNNY